MSEQVYLDKGSKRRIRKIYWKRYEILSAIMFAATAAAVTIAVAVWMMTHDFD
jgi:hypothetical protein